MEGGYQFTQPVMPLLKSLRKRGVRIELFGETATVGRPGEAEASVDAYDLLRLYATGALSLGAAIERILERLALR